MSSDLTHKFQGGDRPDAKPTETNGNHRETNGKDEINLIPNDKEGKEEGGCRWAEGVGIRGETLYRQKETKMEGVEKLVIARRW